MVSFASEYTRDVSIHTATELSKRFRQNPGDIVSYLENLFSYVETANVNVNAITTLEKESGLKRAKSLSSRKAESYETLFGVPVVIKENIQKKGFSVECASRILEGYRGQFDATVVTQLERAGAIVIGTANMDEFAMGSSTERSRHGAVKNPHDLSRVSGGSSGGSAVACALGFAPLTLGSDTGGSVRQPAAYCGVYGFKPSYGRVSRYGLVAYGSSLDQISPFARSVSDLNLLMSVIGQEDVHDATTQLGHFQSAQQSMSLKGKKIGVLRTLLKSGVEKNVLEEFEKLESEMISRGVEFVDIEIPALEHTLSVYYLIACAEASSNLARFDGIRYGHRAKKSEDLFDLYCQSRTEGFGDEVKLRIMLGTFALSAGYYDAFYGKAQAIRALIEKEFASKFSDLDAIYVPTAPSSAFQLGEKAKDPVQMYLNDVFTIPANLAGLCGISVPAKVASGNLPVGLQFLGAKGKDAELLAFAAALEREDLVGVTELK